MALVTVTARRRKVKTDQMGHVNAPATDITYEGDVIDANPAAVAFIQSAGAQAPDNAFFQVTMIGGHTFYVNAADKALLSA